MISAKSNASTMDDCAIRNALSSKLLSEKEANALLVEELGLCQGDVFVDVAVVGDTLEGYEIKSDRDNLRRLERQGATYSQVLSKVTVVLTEKHLEAARPAVPLWWGISLAYSDNDGPHIKTVRAPKKNPAVNPGALVQLLWREEALGLLEDLNLAKGMLSKPRRAIWSRLAEQLPLRRLQSLVCSKIRQRGDWRSASTRTRCGDSYPPGPKRLDFPDHGALPGT